MWWSTFWIILGLVLVIFALLIIFKIADLAASGTFRRTERVKEEKIKKVKEEKKEEQPKPAENVLINVELPKTEPTEQNTVTVNNTIIEKSTSTGTNPRPSRGRIREYYEQRWGGNNRAFDDPYSTNNQPIYNDTSNVYLTQEDVKKLAALKDLFDKKS